MGTTNENNPFFVTCYNVVQVSHEICMYSYYNNVSHLVCIQRRSTRSTSGLSTGRFVSRRKFQTLGDGQPITYRLCLLAVSRFRYEGKARPD